MPVITCSRVKTSNQLPRCRSPWFLAQVLEPNQWSLNKLVITLYDSDNNANSIHLTSSHDPKRCGLERMVGLGGISPNPPVSPVSPLVFAEYYHVPSRRILNSWCLICWANNKSLKNEKVLHIENRSLIIKLNFPSCRNYMVITRYWLILEVPLLLHTSNQSTPTKTDHSPLAKSEHSEQWRERLFFHCDTEDHFVWKLLISHPNVGVSDH